MSVKCESLDLILKLHIEFEFGSVNTGVLLPITCHIGEVVGVLLQITCGISEVIGEMVLLSGNFFTHHLFKCKMLTV